MNCSERSFQTFLYYRVKNLSFSRCLNYQLNSPTPCPFFRGKPTSQSFLDTRGPSSILPHSSHWSDPAGSEQRISM